MTVYLSVNPWIVAAALAYLLIGSLGTMLYQRLTTRSLTYLECLFWTVFWLPAGAVALCVLFLAAT